MSNADEPAYPVTPTDRSGQIGPMCYGLTKREAFAMAVMQGMQSNSGINGWCDEEYARRAVKQADALLAELEKAR